MAARVKARRAIVPRTLVLDHHHETLDRMRAMLDQPRRLQYLMAAVVVGEKRLEKYEHTLMSAAAPMERRLEAKRAKQHLRKRLRRIKQRIAQAFGLDGSETQELPPI